MGGANRLEKIRHATTLPCQFGLLPVPNDIGRNRHQRYAARADGHELERQSALTRRAPPAVAIAATHVAAAVRSWASAQGQQTVYCAPTGDTLPFALGAEPEGEQDVVPDAVTEMHRDSSLPP